MMTARSLISQERTMMRGETAGREEVTLQAQFGGYGLERSSRTPVRGPPLDGMRCGVICTMPWRAEIVVA